MGQLSFSDAEYAGKRKKTRREVFLEEMELVVHEPIPDETTILNFRHTLEAYDLAEDILKQVNAHRARKGLLLKRGSVVDATIIAIPRCIRSRRAMSGTSG